MTYQQTLTRHGDIRNWVINRNGTPAVVRVHDRLGEVHAQLKLSFRRPEKDHEQDEGLSPCSWSAWLAELDRQNLALKVGDTPDACELVERRTN